MAVSQLPILDEGDLENLQDAAKRLGAGINTRNLKDASMGKLEALAYSAPVEDEESPIAAVNRQLNEHALRNLDLWVPRLGLPNTRYLADGRWHATAPWRASNTGRPIEARKPNLSFSNKGIVDFGDGQRGYRPTRVVAETFRLNHDGAFRWLDKHVRAFPGTYDGELFDHDALIAMMERRKGRQGL